MAGGGGRPASAGSGERRLRLIRSTPSADADLGPAPNIDLRDALVRLLVQLPPRQRTVIVLRFWAQLSEAETAEMLGCSEGTVKSATSRGMARLRELAAQWQEEPRTLTGQLLEEPR
jgi:DNA-directed RNA polymerase specialized sigma24 family protein